jgi:XdhC and CoxI family
MRSEHIRHRERKRKRSRDEEREHLAVDRRVLPGSDPGVLAMTTPSRTHRALRGDKKDILQMLTRDEDVLAAAESWREAGRDVAIATVVETWGSAPRPIGSHLVIDAEGNFLGSVSGGCVEGAVVEEAADVIANGEPRMLEFGVADETAWRVGLSCGGRIKVYVEKLG